MDTTLINGLTAGGVLSPGVDLNIGRLTGTDVCLNCPAQKILAPISRKTNIKDAVIEVWCWVHLLMAETERAISCSDHFTLSSGRLFISTLWAGGTTPITAGVVALYLPRCSKLIWRGDYCSCWGAEVVTSIPIKVSTKSTSLSSAMY